MTRTFVIPYSYKQGDKVLTRYFVNYEPETQVYLISVTLRSSIDALRYPLYSIDERQVSNE